MPRKTKNEIPQPQEAKPTIAPKAPLDADAFFKQTPEKRKARRKTSYGPLPEIGKGSWEDPTSIPPPPPLPPKPKLKNDSPIDDEASAVAKDFSALSEEEIADDLRARLWPKRQMLIDRMIFFAEQNQNMQVAERIVSKLTERLYGKIPNTKVELGEEERGLAVTMRAGIYEREDDIPDGTERPEGFDELDDDEAAIVREDAAVDDPDEDEEDEDE